VITLTHKRLIDLDVKKKKVIVRVDFNVPLQEGRVRDDTRIRAALPTLEYLLREQGSLIVLSHLGRPKGKINDDLRLDPVAQRLSDLLGVEVLKSDQVWGPEVKKMVENLKPGQVCMPENTRFDPGEEENSPELAREWASLADVFVSDAFGTLHRAHASNAGLARYLPSAAGLLVEKELEALGSLRAENVDRPFAAILGGAKVSDKLGVIEALLPRVDLMVLGGGMANTFLAAEGRDMGDSLVEESQIDKARELLKKARESKTEIILPTDLVISPKIDASDEKSISEDAITPGWKAVDIGQKSIDAFREKLQAAGTIFWNGPLGVFEVDDFARGTIEIARALSEFSAWTVIGGGDSVAAVEAAGVADKMGHICTGGGAALKYLEGKELPGLKALEVEE